MVGQRQLPPVTMCCRAVMLPNWTKHVICSNKFSFNPRSKTRCTISVLLFVCGALTVSLECWQGALCFYTEISNYISGQLFHCF